MDSVKKNFCLALDVKMVGPKNVANDLKMYYLGPFFVEKYDVIRFD